MESKRFRKIYIEISNVCNLRCAFCPGTKRRPRIMSETEFESLLPKLRPFTDYLYFHIMGEPLCHPLLESFLRLAEKYGFKVILTTNGTLLAKMQEILLASPALHKINISLHAFEANDLSVPFSEYLDNCFEFGKAAEGKKLVVYRLWNHGGVNAKNSDILDTLRRYFKEPWASDWRGARIGEGIYLHNGDKFCWPDMEAPDYGTKTHCMALDDQIGILADGTVVPCCLDHEGDIPLGNIFKSTLEDILQSERAIFLRSGFDRGIATEELCRRCGYAHKKFG